jgi:vancomycin resistance protein VanW
MSRPKSAWAVVDHRTRRLVWQSARLAAWWLAPRRWPAPARYAPARDGQLDAAVVTVRAPLARSDGFADAALEAGKRKNLALAVPAFDGLVLAPSRSLSFWRVLGRAGADRGYTWGMELRGGCVVPAIAGGLCLLSNALFEVAVRSGWQILERHGHSLEAIAPAPDTIMLDATVAWPDVDLVIAPRAGAARLSVRLDDDALVVTAFMAQPLGERIELSLDEHIEARGSDRVRRSRVIRRRSDGSGNVIAVEDVAVSTRRILTRDELGKSCISCGEDGCRDRPRESVLMQLRPPPEKREARRGGSAEPWRDRRQGR